MIKQLGAKHLPDRFHLTATKRMVSLDALRGFTMIFIIGGGELISSFYKVWPNPTTRILAKNMEHAGWEGFYFLDLIFPLFLFLVGVLLPFVILGRIEKGISPRELYRHIVKRTLILIFLGLVNYGLLRFDWDTMRWSSVLGRIGICYFFAALLVIHTNWRSQALLVLVILLGYWAAVMFVPVPGYGPGVLTPEGCLTTWLDQKLIPGTLGLGLYDRQGVLSTFTALATTLIGVLAGHWLRSDKTPNQKTLGFIIAGLITLLAGWIWGQFFFISRNIWTSSFVLYSAGWCLLLLALFYRIIDVQGYKKWTFFLVVIGMNSITIWVGQRLIDFEFTTNALFLGFSKYLGIIAPVFLAISILMIKWLFLWFLYKKKIFLKA
jgi:predicted acyltransferase